MNNLQQNHTKLETAVKQRLQSSLLPNFDDYLYQKIRTRIFYEQKLRALKPKLWAAVSLLAGGLVLLAAALDVSFRAFAQTPTFKFLTLIFTDFGQVAGNWQDYSYSILESLPLGSMAFLLSACLATLVVIDFGVRQYSSFRKLFVLKH